MLTWISLALLSWGFDRIPKYSEHYVPGEWMPRDLSYFLVHVTQDGTAPGPDGQTQASGSNQESEPSQPFSFKIESDVMQWALFFVAIATRMWRLDHPRGVVWVSVSVLLSNSNDSQWLYYILLHCPVMSLLCSARPFSIFSSFEYHPYRNHTISFLVLSI